MARLSNPSLRDVYNEFGATNRPNDLRTMYTRVFGTIVPGVSGLRSFHGFGKPSFSDIETTPGNQMVHLDFEFDNGSRPSDYRVRYADNGAMNNSSYTGWQTDQPEGEHRVTVGGLTNDTAYYFRLQGRNGFNNQAGGDAVQAPSFIETPTSGFLFAPAGLIITAHFGGMGYLAQWNQSAPMPTGYQAHYNYNNQGWEPAPITEEGNWAGSGTVKQAYINPPILWDFGDTFQFRIRGTRANYSVSAWSNIATFNH